MIMIISGIVGAIWLLLVSFLLMIAENWFQMRGHFWRLTSIWLFVVVWVGLGTIVNLVAVLVEMESGADVFSGTDVPDWLESVALTMFTALVLLFIGGGFVAPRLCPSWIAGQGTRFTLFPLGYFMMSFVFWLTTGEFVSDQSVLKEIPAPIGWLGIFTILSGVYGLVILVFRLLMADQSVTLGADARRWLINNTSSGSLLAECRHIQMARHHAEDVFTKAVGLAEAALESTPSMPTHELDAVLEALSPAEAIDAQIAIRRQQRNGPPPQP